MRIEQIPSRGALVKTFVADGPHLPTVLFVNAAGMPGEILELAAAEFSASGLRLVTWELRDSPGTADPTGSTIVDHVTDGLAVLSALGIAQVHVAGWCTGASPALRLCEELAERALSLTSVDGAYLFGGVPGAPIGNAVFHMCRDITADAGRAEYFHDVVRPRGNESAALGITDSELVAHLTRPYRHGVEGLIRYARVIRSLTDFDPEQACPSITTPTLYTARRDDKMVSYRNSVRAAELTPGARVHIADSGGHYALFTDRAAARSMAEFMLSTCS